MGEDLLDVSFLLNSSFLCCCSTCSGVLVSFKLSMVFSNLKFSSSQLLNSPFSIMFVFLSLLFSVSTCFNFSRFSSSSSLSALSLYPQKESRLVSSSESSLEMKMISSSLEFL
jgi:hypothetical protein